MKVSCRLDADPADELLLLSVPFVPVLLVLDTRGAGVCIGADIAGTIP
jgi:hypothetical protein